MSKHGSSQVQKSLFYCHLCHSAGNIEGVCQKIMAESSDLVGVSSYILSEFEKSGGNCHDLSYDAMIGVLSESRYTGNISMYELLKIYFLTNK